MSDITAPINPKPGIKNFFGPEQPGISLGKGILIILLASVLFAAVGIGVGKLFVWNSYSKETKADHDLRLNLENVKNDPANPVAHFNLGISYVAKDEYERAVGEFKKSLALEPKNYSANYYLGLTYMQLRQYDRAIASLKDSIAISPQTLGAHLNLAVSYYYTEKLEDALKELDLAHKYNPASPETRYWTGMINEKQNKLEDALSQYEEALRFSPKYPEALAARDRLKKALNR